MGEVVKQQQQQQKIENSAFLHYSRINRESRFKANMTASILFGLTDHTRQFSPTKG